MWPAARVSLSPETQSSSSRALAVDEHDQDTMNRTEPSEGQAPAEVEGGSRRQGAPPAGFESLRHIFPDEIRGGVLVLSVAAVLPTDVVNTFDR